jgi:hypothetical protein
MPIKITNTKDFMKSIKAQMIKSAIEQVKENIEPELNKKLNKIYYNGDVAPFGSTVFEIDSDEIKIDGTVFEINEEDIFPQYKSPIAEGFRYSSTKVKLNTTIKE